MDLEDDKGKVEDDEVDNKVDEVVGDDADKDDVWDDLDEEDKYDDDITRLMMVDEDVRRLLSWKNTTQVSSHGRTEDMVMYVLVAIS